MYLDVVSLVIVFYMFFQHRKSSFFKTPPWADLSRFFGQMDVTMWLSRLECLDPGELSGKNRMNYSIPIGSMYGIFTYIIVLLYM